MSQDDEVVQKDPQEHDASKSWCVCVSVGELPGKSGKLPEPLNSSRIANQAAWERRSKTGNS